MVGVEPICAVLPIAPSTYHRHRHQRTHPTRRSARAPRDDQLRVEIQRVYDAHQQVYGPRKGWKQLRRDGVRVARGTVARLMRAMGLAGAVRGRAWVTTTHAGEGGRPGDLVDRRFVATRPNQLWVSDFTYVATWGGFVYVTFMAVNPARIRCELPAANEADTRQPTMRRANTSMTLHAHGLCAGCVGAGDLRPAGATPSPASYITVMPGSQYLSMRYTDRLVDAGIGQNPFTGSMSKSTVRSSGKSPPPLTCGVKALFKKALYYLGRSWYFCAHRCRRTDACLFDGLTPPGGLGIHAAYGAPRRHTMPSAQAVVKRGVGAGRTSVSPS